MSAVLKAGIREDEFDDHMDEPFDEVGKGDPLIAEWPTS